MERASCNQESGSLGGEMTNWTEADLAAYLARKQQKGGVAMSDGSGAKARNNLKQTNPRLSEHEEQVALFKLFAENVNTYPELEFAYAIPNGGQRHIAVAARLKAEGVKAGVPDIFIPAPRGSSNGLFVELKAKGGTVTPSQRKMLKSLEQCGYACIVAYGCEGAWKEVEGYLKSGTISLLSEVFPWA